ncbi:MAG: hypothetical protein QNJ63_22635 [Calothrix sp. MO_192.B10]|nr:hypothetical protein [Calothrix sp. MO_192.B10]
MEPKQLITAFLTVVKEQDFFFDTVAITDIQSLQTQLTNLENPTIESLADTIRQWYINHEPVRDAVLIAEREINRVKNADPSSQEMTVNNIFPVLQDELEKLKDKKQTEKTKK